jgi:hypothetical protein
VSSTSPFATCRCQSCGGHIEFNLDGFDPEGILLVSCPHCEANTQLYVPAPRSETKRGQRVTLTAALCATPLVKDFLDLVSVVEEDGVVSEGEARTLTDWLAKNPTDDIPAFKFLSDTLAQRLGKSQFSRDDGYQIQLAIERVLPKDMRTQLIEKRRAAWRGSPASENQLTYIRDLGGSRQPEMTRATASALIERMATSVPATEKQLNFIRDLGGSPPVGITKSEASALIDELLAKRDGMRSTEPTNRQIMVLRFWNRMDLEKLSKEQLSEWMSQFYREDPRRKSAWEIFKLESRDDPTLQHDPSSVPLGIGDQYLQKTALSQYGAMSETIAQAILGRDGPNRWISDSDAYVIQCPYEECSKWFRVPWERKDELIDCPYCSNSVFCDPLALRKIDGSINPATLPPKVPESKTTKLELLCVGNTANGYIHAQISVRWYEMRVDDANRVIQMIGHCLPIRSYRRQERVNYCWFDIPEGVICHYQRRAQVKPHVEERRWFRINEGQLVDLGGSLSFDFAQYYPQYRHYSFSIQG